jgi:hypothetical protein
MKDEPLPKGSLWDKTPRTRRKIVEIGEKQKHNFYLGDFAVFFFNSLLRRTLRIRKSKRPKK